MPRPSILLAALFALAALAGCAQPREPLPTPPPWTPVPLSPDAISPENAGQVQPLDCVQEGARVQGLAFSPDGRLLATASGLGVSLYDACSLAVVQRLETPTDTRDSDHYFHYVRSVAFAPDGATLAAASGLGWIHLWSVGEDEPPRNIESHQSTVGALAFSADGETLATASDVDMTVCIWQIADGQLLRTLEGFQPRYPTSNPDKPPPPTHVAFSPDGSMLAWAANDRVNLWRVSDGRLLRRFGRTAAPVRSLAFSPDGTMAAVGYDSGAAVWRAADGALLSTMEWFSSAHFTSAGLSPDGKILALGELGGGVILRRISDGQPAFPGGLPNEHADRVLALAFSPDGATLASGAKDGSLCLWGLEP